MAVRATTDIKVKSLPNFLDEIDDAYLAGGAVLDLVSGREPNDYDLYPKSKDAAKRIVELLWDNGVADYSSHSDKAVTFLSYEKNAETGNRIPIQVILFDTFESAEKVFSTFDFSVCMIALDMKDEVVYHDERFLQSALSKEVVFNPAAKHPLASILRINKYEKKGYKFGKSTVAQIGFAVAKAGVPTSWDAAASLIGGYYGKELQLAAKDEPFSYELLMEKLGSLDLEQGFNYSTPILLDFGMSAKDTVLNMIEPIKRDHIKLSGSRIVEVRDGLLHKMVGSYHNGKDYSDHLIKSYKYIVADDKGLHSQHNSSFKYELGKVASQVNHPWLFSSKVIDSYKKNNGVLIEVFTLPEYVRDYSYQTQNAILQSAHLYVNRIVPEDEVALLKNKELVSVVSPSNEYYHILKALHDMKNATVISPTTTTVPSYEDIWKQYFSTPIIPTPPLPKRVYGSWGA